MHDFLLICHVMKHSIRTSCLYYFLSRIINITENGIKTVEDFFDLTQELVMGQTNSLGLSLGAWIQINRVQKRHSQTCSQPV